MYRIGLNTAISNFRKQKQNILSTPFSDAAFEIPEPVFADNPNIGALQRAIACLNTAEKAVIMLYMEEKSYEEMAQILGITKSNVGVKLNRIKFKLEILLKSNTYEPR
jgi:RNA polymerase sigma-70 factor (ECF subfamily)